MEKIKLVDFVSRYFNNNKSEFARHHGVHPNVVHLWIRQGYFIILDGNKYELCKTMKSGEINSELNAMPIGSDKLEMKGKENIVHFGNVQISKQYDKPLDMMADSCIVEGFDHLDGKGYSLRKKVAIAVLESLIEEVKSINEI